MKLQVVHRTLYQYAHPVTLAHNQARLTPRSCATQRCLQSRIVVEPYPMLLHSWTDYFGNEATYFMFESPHAELSITLEAAVELLPRDLKHQIADEGTWEEAARVFQQPTSPAAFEASLYTFDSPYVKRGADVRAYAATSFPPNRSFFAGVRELTHRIHKDFRYDPQATTLNTTTGELLQLRRGVCQDFAHLQIACLRSLGLAARYVSGYLVTHSPPGKPKLVGADASHAWLSVFFPQCGWVDFDPTNNCLPSSDHITLAWGRDYFDVAPIKGLYFGDGASTLTVLVDVSLLN